jgi:2-dehydropantoate 2-reductase
VTELTVVGAGAIGGFVAARLLEAGVRVTVVEANEEHAAAMRADGLRVTGAQSLHVHPRVLLPDELDEPLGCVLLAVKARHTADALRTIAPRLEPGGFVVSLQNGLEEYRIAAAVGEERTVGAALTFGGHYERPGEIVYGGPGSLHVGELDGARTDRVARLAELLSLAHPAEVSDSIFSVLWGKTALGAFYFATALVDADLLEFLDRTELLPRLGRVVAEVAQVAAAEGVRLEPVDGFDPGAFLRDDAAAIDASWESQRRYWRGLEARRTGVWRDLNVHRRPTELREILGPVVERAHANGTEVPLLERLVALVEQAERGELHAGYDALAELE